MSLTLRILLQTSVVNSFWRCSLSYLNFSFINIISSPTARLVKKIEKRNTLANMSACCNGKYSLLHVYMRGQFITQRFIHRSMSCIPVFPGIELSIVTGRTSN